MIPSEHRDQEPHTVRQPGVLRVILLCLLPVALLFLVYEIVERTWLTGVDPEVLHILHIVHPDGLRQPSLEVQEALDSRGGTRETVSGEVQFPPVLGAEQLMTDGRRP